MAYQNPPAFAPSANAPPYQSQQPYNSPPPQYAQAAVPLMQQQPVDQGAALMQRFQAITQRYEITDYFAKKLKQLEGFEIVLILDDSGSMNTPLAAPANASPFAKSMTRWDELKGTVGIIVDLAAVFDKDGVDLYFLNRATMLNVTSSDQLHSVFSHPPAGLTPITPVLQHVLNAKKNIMVEKKLLIVIATDGAPTNPSGEVDTKSLETVLKQRNADRCFVTFLACTDDDSSIEYLNKWDKDIKNLDVVDDYQSERREILKAQGSQFRVSRQKRNADKFTFGDYIVKTLLGSVDPEFDKLDEAGGCCSIQ